MQHPIHYRLTPAHLHAHLFDVVLTIAQPQALQKLSLPVWIPGSYLVREFSKNLQQLNASQGSNTLGLEQLDKCTWQVACNAKQSLVLSYQIYAHDDSVRTAWLDASRGFFNGTSLCLTVQGQAHLAHALEIVSTPHTKTWEVATALPALKINTHGFGTYLASNYDELVDCPVEMGTFWSGSFTAHGVPHRFVVAGAPESFDGAKLLSDAQKICETEIKFWHDTKAPPHKNYLFMLNAVDSGYGGLEHKNSTALICNRQDLPRLGQVKQPEGYTTLLGLISHEYFHTWNVKRLRPVEFTSYNYAQENYTQLLWFFEGFTSYYDDLLLHRAGLIDDAGYLKLLNKTINQVLQAPGRLVQSVAQASFDAWVKFYRPDENTANATISYYSKGALVALCLDLTLRLEKTSTLDEVMCALWHQCEAGPMTQADFEQVLSNLGQRSFAQEIQNWIYGTAELPLQKLLQAHGVAVLQEPAQLAQRLGLRVSEEHGVQIKTVLRGGSAEQAGFAAGDDWLAIDQAQGNEPQCGWRLNKLEDLLLYAGNRKKVWALVARDQRLLRLELELPATETTWRLAVKEPALMNTWLGG